MTQKNRSRATRPAQRRNVVTYDYTRCRTLGHAWDAVGPIAGRRRRLDFGTMLTFRCEHCSMHRFDVVARVTGQLLYRFYEQPANYKHDKQSRDTWRAEFCDQLENELMVNLEDER